jgi:general secretion pathway protein D
MIGFSRSSRVVAASLASAALLTPTPTALAQTATPAEGAGQNGAVTLREVEIRAFIEDVSNATGRTFIIDPRVSGRVTVLAQQSMSERELMDVFMSTLRVNGFVAVPTPNGAYRIVPAEVAAREPSSGGDGPSDNTYVSQVFTLRFADAESVSAAIRPLLSERGQVTVNRRGNSLVVVDFGSTMGRLRDVISRLDRDNSALRSVQLRNTSAVEMSRVAQNLATAVGEEGRPLVRAVPVASSNVLVLRGDERALNELVPLIEELDARANYQAGVTVFPLRYAVAADLVPILQQLSASMGAAPGEDASQAPGRRANIAHHQATNSLIISADPETQEALSNVVRSLDVRREQVLVEAIIVEVSDTTARELGLQYVASGASGESALPFLSTSYGASAPNLLALTGAILLQNSDDDDAEETDAIRELRRAAVNSLVGSRGLLLGGGGQRDDGSIFGLLLNALAEDRDSNVLSTPSVMTLDNEQASILVGQQIPITTGEAVGDNLDNQFRTIERADVGVKLEVRPQISEGGAIRLEIRQEVSSIFGQIITSSTDLITNRREIQTVVQVDAGQIIVLGGLIQDDIEVTDEGIPGLRRIPLAGRLFRSEGRSHNRTNLMVFLRPTIVNTPQQADAVTRRQYESLRTFDGLDPIVLRALTEEMDRSVAPSAEAPNLAPVP